MKWPEQERERAHYREGSMKAHAKKLDLLRSAEKHCIAGEVCAVNNRILCT